ncbi:hypothetical protein HDV00_010021 [Rhizophlyctis rosea]|nr:hypothetical protein HDV00_010021 [Rhizophlyctis rosea]
MTVYFTSPSAKECRPVVQELNLRRAEVDAAHTETSYLEAEACQARTEATAEIKSEKSTLTTATHTPPLTSSRWDTYRDDEKREDEFSAKDVFDPALGGVLTTTLTRIGGNKGKRYRTGEDELQSKKARGDDGKGSAKSKGQDRSDGRKPLFNFRRNVQMIGATITTASSSSPSSSRTAPVSDHPVHSPPPSLPINHASPYSPISKKQQHAPKTEAQSVKPATSSSWGIWDDRDAEDGYESGE